MNNKPVVAMALGGLGGFNAHDAGVLAAAHGAASSQTSSPAPAGQSSGPTSSSANPGGIRAEVVQQAAAVRGANALEVAMLSVTTRGLEQAYASYWRRWFALRQGRHPGPARPPCPGPGV